MWWRDFVNRVYQELTEGRLFSDYRHEYENEQALTYAITSVLWERSGLVLESPGATVIKGMGRNGQGI